MVIGVAASCVSAASVVWVSQSGIKETQALIQSDVRSIKDQIEYQKDAAALEARAREQVDLAETRLREEKEKSLREQVEIAKENAAKAAAQYKLEGYDYKTLEARITALERRRP